MEVPGEEDLAAGLVGEEVPDHGFPVGVGADGGAVRVPEGEANGLAGKAEGDLAGADEGLLFRAEPGKGLGISLDAGGRRRAGDGQQEDAGEAEERDESGFHGGRNRQDRTFRPVRAAPLAEARASLAGHTQRYGVSLLQVAGRLPRRRASKGVGPLQRATG